MLCVALGIVCIPAYMLHLQFLECRVLVGLQRAVSAWCISNRLSCEPLYAAPLRWHSLRALGCCLLSKYRISMPCWKVRQGFWAFVRESLEACDMRVVLMLSRLCCCWKEQFLLSLAAWSHLLSQAGFNGYPVGKDSQSSQFHAPHIDLGMAVTVRVHEQ